MSSYVIMLEMRKKYLGWWHLFHIILTLCSGGVWLVIWVVHWLVCNQHNKQIDRKIERVMDADMTSELSSRARG
ncbi:hypothetical protein D3C85_1141130 [compost metagenome]